MHPKDITSRPELPHPPNSTKPAQLNYRDSDNDNRKLNCDPSYPGETWPADLAEIRRLIDGLNQKEGHLPPPLMGQHRKGADCEWIWVSPTCHGDKHDRQSEIYLCNHVSELPTYLFCSGDIYSSPARACKLTFMTSSTSITSHSRAGTKSPRTSKDHRWMQW